MAIAKAPTVTRDTVEPQEAHFNNEGSVKTNAIRMMELRDNNEYKASARRPKPSRSSECIETIISDTRRGWQVRPEARVNINHPPSYYQSKLYYDTVVTSESALRFLIDTVGIDRVVLGSDYLFVGWDPSPGGWVQSLESLTQEEKDKILWKNLEGLLGLGE